MVFLKARKIFLRVFLVASISLTYSIGNIILIASQENGMVNLVGLMNTTSLFPSQILSAINANRIYDINPAFEVANQTAQARAFYNLIGMDRFLDNMGQVIMS